VRLFRERGIDVHEVHQNVTSNREGNAFEIDLLVVNNDEVVVIECKSHLGVDDVNEHLERLEKVKRLLPTYKDKRVSGAVAGMVISVNVAAYAIKKGLYVIGQNGEHLELRNDMSFTAKIW
jgi:RecB family endonuclease NucS